MIIISIHFIIERQGYNGSVYHFVGSMKDDESVLRESALSGTTPVINLPVKRKPSPSRSDNKTE